METEIVVADHELPAEVLQAIAEGRKIVAIKLLRESTGLGLANAKVLVDRAAARYEQDNPRQKGLSEESNTGRLILMIGLLVAAFVVYRFVTSG